MCERVGTGVGLESLVGATLPRAPAPALHTLLCHLLPLPPRTFMGQVRCRGMAERCADMEGWSTVDPKSERHQGVHDPFQGYSSFTIWSLQNLRD